MSLHEMKIEISAMLRIEPKLESIIRKLRSHTHAFYVTTGHSIPAMLGEDYRHCPVLFIASKRMENQWDEDLDFGGAHLTVDGCATGFHSTSYLTWCGSQLSIAIDTCELGDVFRDGESCGQVVVVWVADTLMTLDAFSVDEDFLDCWHVADASRYIPRFVPGQEYIDFKLADFPTLISHDELRIIGAAGEPVYLAVSCDVLPDDR